jgi:hypothetical protein
MDSSHQLSLVAEGSINQDPKITELRQSNNWGVRRRYIFDFIIGSLVPIAVVIDSNVNAFSPGSIGSLLLLSIVSSIVLIITISPLIKPKDEENCYEMIAFDLIPDLIFTSISVICLSQTIPSDSTIVLSSLNLIEDVVLITSKVLDVLLIQKSSIRMRSIAVVMTIDLFALDAILMTYSMIVSKVSGTLSFELFTQVFCSVSLCVSISPCLALLWGIIREYCS